MEEKQTLVDDEVVTLPTTATAKKAVQALVEAEKDEQSLMLHLEAALKMVAKAKEKMEEIRTVINALRDQIYQTMLDGKLDRLTIRTEDGVLVAQRRTRGGEEHLTLTRHTVD